MFAIKKLCQRLHCSLHTVLFDVQHAARLDKPTPSPSRDVTDVFGVYAKERKQTLIGLTRGGDS